jgi:O-antigen/teichoic acid export membrane protein
MAPDLSVKFKHGRSGRIAKNGGLMVGSKFLGVLVGLGSLKLATNFLAPAEVGVLVFIHAYMLFFSEVAAFQSWQSIIRYGTDDLKDKASDKLCRLIGFGIRLDALAAVLAFIAALSMFSFSLWFAQSYLGLTEIGESFSPEAVQTYITFYCLLVLVRQRGASIGVFRLFDKFNVLAVKAVIMPAVRFIGAVIAVVTNAGFEGFLLAWFAGSFAAYVFLPIMAIKELKSRHLLGRVFRAKVNFFKPKRKGLWSFVIKSNIDATLGAATLHLPSLLVFALFGATWTAIYKIAEEVAKLLSEGFKLLDHVIYPELARMVSEGQVQKIWRLTTRAAGILFLFGCFMSGVFFIFGDQILQIVTSKEFSQSKPIAIILVPAAALMGAAAPLYPVFFAADHPERAIIARGAGVVIYIMSLFVLAKFMGPMAAAWSVLIGNLFTVVIVTIMAKYTLEQRVKASEEAA